MEAFQFTGREHHESTPGLARDDQLPRRETENHPAAAAAGLQVRQTLPPADGCHAVSNSCQHGLDAADAAHPAGYDRQDHPRRQPAAPGVAFAGAAAHPGC